LQYREVGGTRVRCVGRTGGLKGGPEGVIDGHNPDPRELRAEGLGTLRRQEQAGLAIVEAERQPLRAEEREQGHRDRTALDGPEQTHIECLPRIEDDGHAVAMANPQRREPVGEATGEIGEGGVIVVLAMAVGKLDADRRALVPVAVEALMGQIHMVAVTIKQGPEVVPGEQPHHVVVCRELGEWWHTGHSHAAVRMCIQVPQEEGQPGAIAFVSQLIPYNRAITCRENSSAKCHFSSFPVANINSCTPWRSSSRICPRSSSAVPTKHVARISSASISSASPGCNEV